MAGDRRAPETTDEAILAQSLESFSRDLLALVRAIRVYPPAHPFLQNLTGRLVAMVGGPLPAPLVLGVTSRELSVAGRFVGGKDSRAAELAAFLHGRKVLRVTWTRETGHSDVTRFAELLGDPKLSGEDLGRALRRRRVFAIDLEPLVLERIHEAFQQAPRGAPRKSGGREAWQWLLSGEASPEDIAGLLVSDGLWELPEDGATGAPGAPRPAEVLFRMGERLDAALEHLSSGQRRIVLDRLSQVGRQLSSRELAGILHAADSAGVLDGPLGDVVEETFGGDQLVDLLAGLVEREGRSTRRLAEVYGRLAPGETGELLDEVRSRLASPGKGGFTLEVWEAVEDFLLGAKEGHYMADDYASSLEAFASAAPDAGGPAPEEDFTGAVEDHLDSVLLGLALDDPNLWGRRLLDRLGNRTEELHPTALFQILGEIRAERPGLLDGQGDILERVFRAAIGRLRELDPAGREAFLAFGQAHEGVLLDAVLRVLAEDGNISVRRFLVELVAGFSPAATPALVTRMRSSPWFVTRNLVIALGRKGEGAAVPVLRSLLGHEHPKVRREAILALAHFPGPEARQALRSVASGKGSTREERALAERALQQAARPRGTA